MQKLLLLFTLMIMAFALHGYWHESEIIHAAGVLVPGAPQQTAIEEARTWTKDEYQIRALAQFSLEARVLGKERYWLDRAADLSPIDLVLGWGPMSDQKILDQLDISQSGRRYFWWARQPPLPAERINAHCANMHMIPADEDIAIRLKEIRRGEIISLRGYLISVRAPDGWNWRSSLSRTDQGDGACEVIWVESLMIRD
jgi:hypothetical protein